MPRFWAKAKPFLSFIVVSHHPLVHLPTSTVVPFGIRVRTSLSKPGDFRKLVSAERVTGFAIAPTADRRVMMAADAAIRTKLMAVLVFLPRVTPPARRYLTPAAAPPSSSRIQKTRCALRSFNLIARGAAPQCRGFPELTWLEAGG